MPRLRHDDATNRTERSLQRLGGQSTFMVPAAVCRQLQIRYKKNATKTRV